MQSIIMVSDMNCANCAKKIESALKETRIDFRIDVEKKIVVVNGSNDMLRLAKQVITDTGFTVM